MIDAQKLNDTVKELENEVEHIKSISKLVEDISKLSNDISMNNEAYESAINNIKLAKEEIHKINESNEVLIKKTTQSLKDINDTIDERILEVHNENISFNKEISKRYNEMEANLIEQLQNVRSETKKLYLEIDELMTTRLDKNKSDIQLEIRNNSNELSRQIQKDVTEMINEMHTYNKSNNEEVTKKMKKQDILLYVLILLIIASIGLRYI